MGAPGRQRVIPVGALRLGDFGPEHLGQRGGVHLDPVRGHGLRKQRVVGPHRGHELGRLARQLGALGAAQHLREAVGGERLSRGLRGHVGVGRKEVAEVGATRHREDTRHQKEPAHEISES